MNLVPGRSHEPGRPPEIEDAFVRGGIANRRLLAIGLLLAVLMLASVAGGLAWNQYQAAQRTALEIQRARAVVAGSVIDTYFRGEVAAMNAIAASPSVVTSDATAMMRYFSRLQGDDSSAFGAGLGWVDRSGTERVSTARGAEEQRLDLSDRSYFQNVLATGRPYVSEGIASRVDGARVIVMAVPTKDARGRVTGVLAAALLRRPFAITKGSLDLGGPGVVVLDREGSSVLGGAPDPSNADLVASLRGTGSLPDTPGLDGSDGHDAQPPNPDVRTRRRSSLMPRLS